MSLVGPFGLLGLGRKSRREFRRKVIGVAELAKWMCLVRGTNEYKAIPTFLA